MSSREYRNRSSYGRGARSVGAFETVVQFSVTCPGRRQTPGGVAQLGEHLLCKQGVRGSIPLISTERRGARDRDENRTLNYGL